MGFFKDIKKLSDQAADVRAQYPVSQQLADAQASMAHGAQVMAGMAANGAANATAMANGVAAIATVVSARQTGAMVNYNPMVHLELLVMMPSGVPVPVSHEEVVMQIYLSRCQPGLRLNVKVDPANPTAVWVDWASPVF